MRDPGNIDAICASDPDYIGFIFYPKSKRFVGNTPDAAIFSRVPDSVRKVGVFVNEKPETVMEICHKYKLEVAQLHGSETATDCMAIKKSGLKVFKAFSVGNDFNFDQLNPFQGNVDYFLFDTKGKLPGGTGEKFNWQILKNYRLDTPFFLSGGIKPNDCPDLLSLDFNRLFAVDINSGFETEPGFKEVVKVAEFIEKMRN